MNEDFKHDNRTPRLLTAVLVLLCMVALFQLALLLQRHLATRPTRPEAEPALRPIAWNPEDEMAAMHAQVSHLFDQAFSTPYSPHPPAVAAPPPNDGSAGSLSTDPFLYMRQMQQRIDSLFANAMNSRHQPAGIDEGWNRLEITPGFSVKDNGDVYEITVQLPDVNKSDIHIQMDRSILTLSVDQNVKSTSHSRGGTHQEFLSTRHFERHLRLPGATHRQDAIKATFANEVLTISVPKDPPTETPPQPIPIH